MTAVNDQAMKVDYFFDSFPGWCYASAPALNAVAERFSAALTMRPSGLFAGARPIASIADHSWRNAKRIAELTGQVYTPSNITTTFSADRMASSIRFSQRARSWRWCDLPDAHLDSFAKELQSKH